MRKQDIREKNALNFVEFYGIVYFKVKGKYLVYDRTYNTDCNGSKETCRFYYNLDKLDGQGFPSFDHKEILSFVKHKNTNRG